MGFLSSAASILRKGLFWRVSLAPFIMWCLMVASALLVRQPGVICITPLAWLMALWCGVNYVNGCAGQPDPYPLLAPGLAGALQGLAQGALFDLAVILDFPLETSREKLLALAWMLGISLAGILVCALLSMFSAWLRLRSYPRQQP